MYCGFVNLAVMNENRTPRNLDDFLRLEEVCCAKSLAGVAAEILKSCAESKSPNKIYCMRFQFLLKLLVSTGSQLFSLERLSTANTFTNDLLLTFCIQISPEHTDSSHSTSLLTLVRFSHPSAVINMSSSMRTPPILRYPSNKLWLTYSESSTALSRCSWK